MAETLNILILEDNPADSELMLWQLRRAGLSFVARRVDTRADFCRELETFAPEIILSDNSLPDFDGLSALSMARARCPATPFIFVSGTIGEEQAVAAMKQGATDFLLKDRLSRLGSAVSQALEHHRLVRDKARAEAVLRLRNLAIEASVNGVIITDYRRPDNPIEYVNSAFERITGYAAAEAMGRNCRFLQRDDRNQPELEKMRAAIHEQRECRAVIRNYRKDGSLFWNDLYIAPVRDDDRQVTHFIGVQNDVTVTKRYQEQLEYQANYDSLTGLPNRNLLQDRLNRALSYADRKKGSAAVVFIDLDNFKYVNDSLGHNAGDQLLKIVAARLRSSLRDSDTVARQGGDEFVMILSDVITEEGLVTVIRRMLDTLVQPITLHDREINITCSVGICIYPHDGDDGDTLLRNADVAMYRAKELGRNTFQFYTQALNARVTERLALENNLRRALEREEFLLYYQPQVDLRTGQITSTEALLRWQQPELGWVAPDRFIPLAEEIGLIIPIGEWVLKTACAQNKAWQDEGLPRLRVSVNLSARQFRQPELVETVSRILSETGLDARYLELELTESLLMQDIESATAILDAFKDMGVRLAIDDFGIGYSSLNYLKRFPIDLLKIDRSFVKDITIDPDDAAIALGIIALAHSLNLEVIAEGVETEAQLAFLQSKQCDAIQGFYFSQPLPSEKLSVLFRENRTLQLAQL